jgi:predicted anti-sigma-YlaC factor YlaD
MTDAWSHRLSEYLDDSLPAQERAELESHLRTCEPCRNDVAELRAVIAWLKSDSEDVVEPASFAAIRTRIKPKRPKWNMIIPWAAAAVLAIVAGSLWLGQRPEPGSRPELTPYHVAVADLEEVLRQSRGKLDPTTEHQLENSIALIDRAIRQSENELRRDSSNEFVSRHLGKLHEAKLAALRAAVTVARAQL